MKRKRFRVYLALALLTILGGFSAVYFTDSTPRLGLDLEGGLSVILTATDDDVDPEVLEETADIIRTRIDALGVAEPEVSVAGERNILIQLPGLEDEQAALELIGTTAQLTFRQVDAIIDTNTAKEKDIPEITTETGREVNQQEVVYPDAADPKVLYRLKPAKLTGVIVDEAEAILDPQTNQWSVSIDMSSAGSDVWEEFTSELACLRDDATTPEQVAQSQVAIVLDGKVESAAGMSEPGGPGGTGVECGTGISGGQTSITTGDEQESKDLALVLRTGALPLTLEQSQVSKVSPTLGEESLQQGVIAGAVGLGLVMIYMIVYYKALGFVVWLGLALFSLAMYSLLAFLGESAGLSLSLAGVAGVIVSIGVTADSYIVAFERLKDEIRTGKSVRAAVERGMVRAFRTILVADFVTGAGAVILFYLAVGPVRGFALTLGLATLLDIFIAYFFTRPAVNLLAARQGIVDGRYLGLKRALGVAS